MFQNARLRYFVRIVVIRNYASKVTKDLGLVVQSLYNPPGLDNTIKMKWASRFACTTSSNTTSPSTT